VRAWRNGRLSTIPVHGLDEPGGLCVLPDGRLAVADTNHHRVVFVDAASGDLQPFALPAAGAESDVSSELAPSGDVGVRISLDIGDDELDPSDGPPVRVSVSADPPRLLSAGARSWALNALPAKVTISTGAEGAGTLAFDVRAASCKGDECRLHTRRVEVRVHLEPGGSTRLEL